MSSVEKPGSKHMLITYLKLLMTAIFWGGTFIAGRVIAGHVNPVAAAFLRFVVASVFLVALTLTADLNVAEADGSALYVEMEEHGKIVVALPDGPIDLTPDEVEVRLSAREDFAAASGSGQVVVLDTRVDDSLRREGLAREVINRIQRARKAMDLAYEARIDVRWNAEGELADAIEEHTSRIASETLAERFAREPGASGEHDTEIEGAPLGLSIAAV